MTRRFTTLFAILVAASLATAGRYQARVLLVRVIESGSPQPLPNAEVIDLESGARRFTNTAGKARIAWPPCTGPHVVQLLELLDVTYRKETPPAGDSSERR